MDNKKFDWAARLKNPLAWFQIILMFILVALAQLNMEPTALNTWPALFNFIVSVFKNPYLLTICLLNVWSAWNDPKTKGLSD